MTLPDDNIYFGCSIQTKQERFKMIISCNQVDLTEGRYLLAAASERATEYEGAGRIAKHKSILSIDKQHENGHKYAISSAIWYPIDTGLFITGSYDHNIKVWDTNTTQVVMNFKMPGKVYRTAMSPISTSHMLIAAGTEDVQLCGGDATGVGELCVGFLVDFHSQSQLVEYCG